MDIRIRRMEEKDLDRIIEVEKNCFSTPWSRESFILEITKNQLARYFVAEVDGVVAGYGGIWLILGEGHITNIAVDEDYRRMGLGRKLLEALIELSRNYELTAMTLEVRASNEPAKSLYKSYNFVESGRRPNYYQDLGEDAIIMWKNLESRE